MIDIDIINTTYQDIITLFVLNTMLHHLYMLWIIETQEQLKYDIEKHNSDWMTLGQWCNTYICKNYMEMCLRDSLEVQELTDIISCVL